MSLIKDRKIKTMVKYCLSPNTLSKTQKLENILLLREALGNQINSLAIFAKCYVVVLK